MAHIDAIEYGAYVLREPSLSPLEGFAKRYTGRR